MAGHSSAARIVSPDEDLATRMRAKYPDVGPLQRGLTDPAWIDHRSELEKQEAARREKYGRKGYR